jgi:hypothetical protein
MVGPPYRLGSWQAEHLFNNQIWQNGQAWKLGAQCSRIRSRHHHRFRTLNHFGPSGVNKEPPPGPEMKMQARLILGVAILAAPHSPVLAQRDPLPKLIPLEALFESPVMQTRRGGPGGDDGQR